MGPIILVLIPFFKFKIQPDLKIRCVVIRNGYVRFFGRMKTLGMYGYLD